MPVGNTGETRAGPGDPFMKQRQELGESGIDLETQQDEVRTEARE